MAELPDVCVVTQPVGATDVATRDLLRILAAITSVSLVTAGLPRDSPIRRDHEVVDISASGTGVTVLQQAVRFVRNQGRMCLALGRREEDVVLFFGSTSYWLPILCARLMGKTVVVEPRGDVPLALRLAWERALPGPLPGVLAGVVGSFQSIGFRLADALVTYTPSMAEDLGLRQFDHKLYPYGARFVDTDTFAVDESWDGRDRAVGYVGRLDAEKNLETVAAVARRLPDGVRFRIVGDGERRAWLESALADEAAAGTVEFLGWVDHGELPAVLNGLRLLVLPSHTEGLPTIVLEAMACGTPAYATPVAGVPDVVRPGETGFLMHDLDPDHLADQVVRILDDPETADVSHRARALIDREYDFDAATDRYRTILREVGRRAQSRSSD